MSNLYNTLPCHLAILAPFDKKKMKPLGKQTSLIKLFFQTALAHQIFCGVFSPKILSKNKSEYIGVFHDGSGWIESRFSRPKIIYDRYYSAMTGFDPGVERQKDNLAEKFMFLNPLKMARKVTDKHAFSELMKSMKIPSPVTVQAAGLSRGNMIRILKEIPDIIIKPRFGRMGRGIIRVKRNGNGYHIPFGKMCLILKSPDAAYGAICEILRGSNLEISHCMVQKTVKIPFIQDRYFDIRILVQRTDGELKPKITGSVARLSQSRSAVPNLDQGGLVMSMEQVFEKFCSGFQIRKIRQDIQQLALNSFDKMEMRFGKIGELGIDILVDNNLCPRVIEMNSKPGRIAFQRMASGFGLSADLRLKFQSVRDESIRNPMIYGKWLYDQVASPT